jgi:hypothetical protein
MTAPSPNLVFAQRLGGVLRDVEIGFIKGTGFTGAAKMEKQEEWISAAKARELLKQVSGSEYAAKFTICKRAHAGLIRSRAETLVIEDKTASNAEISPKFWWAEGNEALEQDWPAGDFSTWVGLSELTGNLNLSPGKVHVKAFCVTFARADIEKMLPSTAPAQASPMAQVQSGQGGRPRAEYWDDLWVEISRQLYGGELIPKRQADIEKAMMDWLAKNGEHPYGSWPQPGDDFTYRQSLKVDLGARPPRCFFLGRMDDSQSSTSSKAPRSSRP